MKHLLSYKSYESKSFSLKDDISAMLLDLEDDGMIVDYHQLKADKSYEFVISKPNNIVSNSISSTYRVMGYNLKPINLVMWK